MYKISNRGLTQAMTQVSFTRQTWLCTFFSSKLTLDGQGNSKSILDLVVYQQHRVIDFVAPNDIWGCAVIRVKGPRDALPEGSERTQIGSIGTRRSM